MTHLDDHLLTALRATRPDTSDQPSATSPEAAAMLTRILTAPEAPAHEAPTRRVSRRRLLLYGLPATAGAVAAVVVATAVTSPGTPSSGSVPTAASVRAAVLDAFQQDRADIFYATSTIITPKGPVQTSHSWGYPAFPAVGQQVRYREFTFMNGVPAEDSESIYIQNEAMSRLTMSTTQGPRSAEMTDVQYNTKTWSKGRTSSVTLGRNLSPALIQEEIASGHFTVVGRGHIRGREAIELTWSSSPRPARPARPVRPSLRSITTLWVDAHSYVPIRSIGTMLLRLRGHDTVLWTSTAEYQLLPATPANLKLLSPPIPAGFHRTSPNF